MDTINEVDSTLLREWRNSPEIFKWSRQNDLLTESQHQAWMQSHPQNKSVRMYLIRDVGSQAIGVCGLTDIDLVNQRAEFSIYIAPEHIGKGFGTDALRLLCHHGFNSYPLEVIWGECFANNPALECFKKVGFKQDGLRRAFYFRDGNHIDAALISLKKDEFII